MNAKELLDLEVVGSTAWKIGKVKDIVIDTRGWQVTALDVELEKSVAEEFNVGRRFGKTHIPMSITHIQAVGDRVILKPSKEEVLQQVAAAEASQESNGKND